MKKFVSLYYSTRELYLDGNDLRCAGVQDLIRVVAEEAEHMAIKRELEKSIKLQEDALTRDEGIL